MLDKIEVGKEYIDEDGTRIKALDIGNIYVVCHDITSSLKCFISLDEAKENWSEKPKPKVKRAKYLYHTIDSARPVESTVYYIDKKDFIRSFIAEEEEFDLIIRLQETEREFDV